MLASNVPPIWNHPSYSTFSNIVYDVSSFNIPYSTDCFDYEIFFTNGLVLTSSISDTHPKPFCKLECKLDSSPCNAEFKVITNSLGNGMSSAVIQVIDPSVSISYIEFYQNNVLTYTGAPQSYMLSPGSYKICIVVLNKTGEECRSCQEFIIKDKTGECMDFDGTNDYLISQTNVLNNIGTGDFTFEATVNALNAEQGNHPMIFSNQGVSLFFHNNWGGSFTRMLCLQLGGVNYLLMNNGTFNANILDGECHHVAVSRRNTKLSFYIDGQFVGARAISGNPSISGGELNIGKYHSNAYFFDGNISEVRIWKGARTDDEISDNMNIPISIQSGLEAYFQLNDGAGQIADNKVDNFDAQLGSTGSVDGNDPSWTEGCCNKGPVDGNEKNKQFSSSEIMLKQDISVYPNPSNGLFNVKIENSENSVIEVVNSLGKTILIQNVNSNISNIDLTSQPNGVYFVKVVSGELMEVKRVIKN